MTEGAKCEDCGLPYTKFLIDVVLTNDQWRLVSGRDDGSGLLCGRCIVERGALLEKDGKPLFSVAKLTFE